MHSLGFGIIAIHSTYMQNKYTPTVRSVYQEICTQIRDGRLPWFAYGRLSEKALVYIQPRWFRLSIHILSAIVNIQISSHIFQLDHHFFDIYKYTHLENIVKCFNLNMNEYLSILRGLYESERFWWLVTPTKEQFFFIRLSSKLGGWEPHISNVVPKI